MPHLLFLLCLSWVIPTNPLHTAITALDTLHWHHQGQCLPCPHPTHHTRTLAAPWGHALFSVCLVPLGLPLRVGGLSEWWRRSMLLYLWKSFELLGGMIKFYRAGNEPPVTAARNLWHILMSGPHLARPIMSFLRQRLYLWEVPWAGSPKTWAWDSPANCVTVWSDHWPPHSSLASSFFIRQWGVKAAAPSNSNILGLHFEGIELWVHWR